MSKIVGGCLCGAVRYESSAEPVMIAACHCATCQKNTGSAFSLNIGVPEDSVSIEGESLATYEDRAGASGKPFYRRFCSRCGSPISGHGEAYAGLVFLKAGTLDDPTWIKPGAHIWCSEKQPWVNIDEDAAAFPRNPG
ncbi:MAG: GFA family protein [Gammaproteobacteria bacterium]|nr:GFA family protein [Gammaproteobacteria bacterium]